MALPNQAQAQSVVRARTKNGFCMGVNLIAEISSRILTASCLIAVCGIPSAMDTVLERWVMESLRAVIECVRDRDNHQSVCMGVEKLYINKKHHFASAE